MKNIIGGLGDFLQIIDSAKKEEEISVYTHQSYQTAFDFFQGIDVKANIETFDSLEELQELYQLSYETPLERTLHPHIQFPDHSLNFANNFKKANLQNLSKVTVGVHPFGSDFSNKHWGDLGLPTKNIPINLIDTLTISFSDYNFLIFGTESEIAQWRGQINATFICCPNIWDSLACVSLCDSFVGTDSSFKTMSVMSKIPTIIVVGDYEDNFRDDNFITPYKRRGQLTTIKFTELDEEHLNQIKDFISV